MSDFPKGGDIEATRAWLDKEGFVGLLNGWTAESLLGQDNKEDIIDLVGNRERGLQLWGFLNTARQTPSPGAPGGGGSTGLDAETLRQVFFQALSQSVDAIADVISNKLNEKRRHRVSASGVATGVNSPPTPNQAPSVMMMGTTEMPLDIYVEAQRYFELFSDAIKLAYPHGGYEIGIHEPSAHCVIKHRRGRVFQFPFEPDKIKNHYVTFRLLNNNMESYLAQIRSQTGQTGVNNFINACTSPSGGSYTLSYR